MDIQAKREKEKEVVSYMISLYCRKKHGGDTLCPECAELDAYSAKRSDLCPFMETKTFCANCKVHCYKKDMRERIQEVMKFSGPRMPIPPTGHGHSPRNRNPLRKKKTDSFVIISRNVTF